MHKKKRKKPVVNINYLFRKSSLAGILLLLFATFFKMGDSILESHCTELPSSSTPLRLYSNQTQDDLTQLYLQSIKEAQQSIDIVIYSLLDKRIIAALQQKIDEGIPVFIVCDAKASVGIGRKLIGATIVKRFGPGLTHQKILIIDHDKILLGSANFTHDSMRVHGNLVIGLNNAALAKTMVDKIHSMDEEGNYTPLMHLVTKAGNQTVELWQLPDNSHAAEKIIQLLRTAKKSIKVAMFTWTRYDFTKELINASLRGVKVETVIDRYSGKGASAKIVEMLKKAKIPVHFNTTQGLLHHKFAYIDEEILINGSANWTNAAFKTNDDVFLIVYPLTSEQKAKMNQLWKVIWKESI